MNYCFFSSFELLPRPRMQVKPLTRLYETHRINSSIIQWIGDKKIYLVRINEFLMRFALVLKERKRKKKENRRNCVIKLIEC